MGKIEKSKKKEGKNIQNSIHNGGVKSKKEYPGGGGQLTTMRKKKRKGFCQRETAASMKGGLGVWGGGQNRGKKINIFQKRRKGRK